MPGSTPRLGIPFPLGTENVSAYPAVAASAGSALDNAYQYQYGTLANLPAAAAVPPGTAYWATDANVMFHAVGGSGDAASAWINAMFSPGDLKVSAITSPPTGWLLCNGQTVASATYAALYTAIGTAYGGNSSNFALPDLRGRVPLGAGTGTATYASAWTLGQQPSGANLRGGEEAHALGEAELAAHSHGGNTVTGYASVGTDTGYASIAAAYADNGAGNHAAMVPASVSVVTNGLAGGGGNYAPVANSSTAWGGTQLVHSHNDNGHSHGAYDNGHYHGIPSDGSNSAHNTMSPVSVVNWFIKY